MSLLHFLAVGLFQIKLMRLFIYMALISNWLAFLIGLYQFMMDAESVYIIQYGPIISGSIYVLASLCGILFMRDAEKFQHEFDFWSEHNANKETQIAIKQHIYSVNVYVILNTVLAFVAGTSLILPNKDESHYHYAIKILMEMEIIIPRKIIRCLYYLYKVDFVLMFPLMTVNSLRALYFSRKFKFQVKLLVERIKEMTKNYNVDDPNLFYNVRYQDEMKQKLKLFIRRHSYIAQYVAKINKSIGPFIVMYAISATLLGICVLLIAATGTIYYSTYQIILSGAIYLSTLFCAIDASETVEIESAEIYNTILVQSWYTWNNENRTIFIIFLMNCEKPIQITKFSDTFYVNYNWGISVLKKIYSLGSVFFNLRGYIDK
ncbi:uncharacterized protein LOC123007767 [Tribolium madens]|uniref:uncharacterized protein LOC123007767 n=1 Tax=Tribolium madens TaxID=41895 RepID=UPI001CF75283|nr:uncharacterized protein LOC123007767 [Tribolium madens]